MCEWGADQENGFDVRGVVSTLECILKYTHSKMFKHRYSEQLTDRWKHYVDEMGWKIGHEPTPAEVVDAIASVYALESTSVPHAYKAEIMRFCVHLSSYCASDYFGWDVRGSSPPSSGVPELCIKCGSCTAVTQRRGSFDANEPATCSKCSETLNLLTRQRALCNALVYLYYANRVGVKLGADYKDALKWLPEVRPYKGPPEKSYFVASAFTTCTLSSR